LSSSSRFGVYPNNSFARGLGKISRKGRNTGFQRSASMETLVPPQAGSPYFANEFSLFTFF
ncbi:MAG TPA: hypothetical protein VFX48_04130, partial [Saprospiraceae bacterium]|nr:hypothetical protein [Saprospiraceae bacterium]